MRAHIPRVVACGLAVALIAATGNAPSATVSVDGVPLTYSDVLQISGLMLISGEIVRTGIAKQPAEMPAAFPYVYFAGTDAGGKPIVWVSSIVQAHAKLSDSDTAELTREAEGAGLMAALVSGQGTPAVRRLYEEVKNDPNKLASLGAQLTSAMKTMSQDSVQYQNDERRWIFQSIPAGTPRLVAEDLLRSHGLVAAQKGDTMVVTLPGAFQPGCYWSASVTLTFKRETLYKIDLSPPIPDCL